MLTRYYSHNIAWPLKPSYRACLFVSTWVGRFDAVCDAREWKLGFVMSSWTGGVGQDLKKAMTTRVAPKVDATPSETWLYGMINCGGRLRVQDFSVKWVRGREKMILLVV
jgi:hypothetical protein